MNATAVHGTTQALQVAPLGSGRYRVTGGRTPYLVELDRDRASCTCPDHVYRHRACKHLVAVVNYVLRGTAQAAGPGLERDVPPPDPEP